MPRPIQHVLDRITCETGFPLVLRLLGQSHVGFGQILPLGLQDRV